MVLLCFVSVQYLHRYEQKSIKIAFGDGIFACMSRDFQPKRLKTPRGILPTE